VSSLTSIQFNSSHCVNSSPASSFWNAVFW
jgi:hypothetical protein